MTLDFEQQRDRALGALTAGALGDALGMPTQTMTHEEIFKIYGEINGFTTPYKGHPVAAGLSAASVTDDTEQSLLLARQLLEAPGPFDEKKWACALMNWEAEVKARGLHDLLGPSTKKALEGILSGEPVSEVGRYGNTNGAAMRIAPIGISTPIAPLETLIERVVETSRVTHNTPLAISAAAAVAAAISAGVEGADYGEATKISIETARLARKQGYGTAKIDIAKQIEQAVRIANQRAPEEALSSIVAQIGTGVASQESVPTAFALLHIAKGDAWKTGLLSARIGGDTDTIGAISAGIAGACLGFRHLPEQEVATLNSVNVLDLEKIADGLLELRRQAEEGLA